MNSSLQKTTFQKASEAFWSHLSLDHLPSDSEIQSASISARDAAFQALQDDEALQQEFPKLSANARKQLHYNMLGLIAPLHMPTPSIHLQLAPWRLAFVGLLGAFIGIFLLTPLTTYLLKMRDLGLFLGGPLGAFGMIWLSLRLTEDGFLRKTLGAALGVAVTTEIFLFLHQNNPLSQIWSRLAGKQQSSAAKRFALYALGLLLVLLSKKEQKIDKEQYTEQIQAHLTIWVTALFKCIHLYHGQPEEDAEPSAQQKLMKRVGSLLLQLHKSSKDDLDTVAHELLIESKNLGFEGLGGVPSFLSDTSNPSTPESPSSPQTFAWTEKQSEQYETFGAIEEGDEVKVEKHPLCSKASSKKKASCEKCEDVRSTNYVKPQRSPCYRLWNSQHLHQ